MNRKPNFANVFLSILVGMTLLVSAAQPNLVSASTELGGGDGVRTSVHPQTGKLSFLGADPSSPIRVDAAMRAELSAEGRGLAILDVYGPQFGLKNPQEELRLTSTREAEGRGMTKYQQLYQGVPVMAGELIVNTNAKGGLLSINGEVSPDLDISVTPNIDAALAQSVALQEIASAYGLSLSDVVASEPELWIYDARLMNGEDETPAHLVWRMEVTSENAPLRELVLVNAQSGKISLHFNQIDTAWGGNETDRDLPASEPVYEPEAGVEAPISAPNPGDIDRFVSPTGVDAGTCSVETSPCLSITYAISQVVNFGVDGEIIAVAEGVYIKTNPVDNFVVQAELNNGKGVNIYGGWNADFSAQVGFSVIDGENKNRGVGVYGYPEATTILFDHFIVRNGWDGGINLSTVSLIVTNSSIYNNHKVGDNASGGGIDSYTGNLTLRNVTVSNNSASSTGGGIYKGFGSAYLNNVTVTNNTAGYAGGITFSASNQPGAVVNVKNTIVYNNHALIQGPDCYGSVNSSSTNIIGDTTDCTMFPPTNGNQLNVNPLLGTFIEGVGYQPLLAGSPAIDAGASCYGSQDQRGYTRVEICDIGAYEFPSSTGNASKLAIAGGNQQTTAPHTTFDNPLAAAILDANGSPVSGQAITFTAPGSGAGGTFSGGLTSITITTAADGVAKTSFTANGGSGDYQVEVESVGLASINFDLANKAWYVRMSGNDLADCLSPATACKTINAAIEKADLGGAILISSGVYRFVGPNPYYESIVSIGKSIRLSGGWDDLFVVRFGVTVIDGESKNPGISIGADNVKIDHVTVQNGYSLVCGGGIVNGGKWTEISYTTILNSEADHCGGGLLQHSQGTLILRNSSIHNNMAANEGGGISVSSGILEIYDSTIANNRAFGIDATGGGIKGIAKLNNVTVTGNYAAGSGGGIYGNVILENSILAQNDSPVSPDCYGDLTSLGYNIVGHTDGCNIPNGPNDKLNVDPKLNTFLPSRGYQPIKSNSPARNSANPLTCSSVDQRGGSRVGICDRGAYEYTAPGAASVIEIVDGDHQRTAPRTTFLRQFKVVILDANGSPVSGQNVEFSAPASGPSGLFQNGTILYSTATDAGGVATAATFTANNQSGHYIVSASASVGSANFNVANQALYVSPNGNDSADCLSPGTACLSIAKAISKSNDDDMILVATGTYHGAGNNVVTINRNIALLGGWNLSFSAQTGYSTINGQGKRSGVIVNNGANASMQRFIVTNSWSNAQQRGGVNNFGTLSISDCEISNNNPSYRGGGVYNLGSMTITDCVIKNNTGTTSGGGIHSTGTLTISNSTIQGNTAKRLTSGAQSYGGGVYSEGVLVISDSQILANDGFLGGGIYSIGDLIVTQSSIKDNTSANGGGLFIQMAADIKNTSITGNTATGPGGGIFAASSALSLTKVTISGNTASSGGGIYNPGNTNVNDSLITKNLGVDSGGGIQSSGGLTLDNSVVKANTSDSPTAGDESPGAGLWISGIAEVRNSSVIGNTASGPGGGVYVSEGTLSLVNVTVSGNEASSGGGIFNSDQTLPVDPVSIVSSTVANNQGDDSGNIVNKDGRKLTLLNSIVIGSVGSLADCAGAVNSVGYNIIGNVGSASSPTCRSEWLSTDMVGTSTDAILAESVIKPTISLHASTGQWRHALFLGSLALEAGNDALPGSGGNACPATDQLGVARPQGARCDIGAAEYRFETNPPASLLVTFNAGNETDLPGIQACAGNTGACSNSDASAKSAHQFAFSAFSQFKTWYGRKSMDGNGLQIKSVVHYGKNVDDSFWNGFMLVYGDDHGYALADDIVAHEYAHGVTQYESNLFYWYQSGAINESFSDLWGEAVDQANGLGNDAVNVKWLIGEDIGGLGAVRSMANPPQFSDPDSTKSALYCKSGNCLKDNGGVHTNSGVNNKAAYLMVNGGTFGGKSVSALGWAKTLAVYYEAQANLLSSGADYLDLYNALYQACLNKVGSQGISANDCLEVRDATLAVKMNQPATATFNPDAPYCPAKTYMIGPDLFSEDFETASDGWTMGALDGVSSWGLSGKNATSGTTSLWGDDSYEKSDSFASTPGIALPAGTKNYLHFTHSFAFEVLNSVNYDGGVLEYSVNGGSSWVDAKPLFSAGQNYKGVIKTGTGNRLGGKNAFVGDSHGYVDSRYDLSSLAGKTVRFRWRMGTSADHYSAGWHVDDVRVYRCVSIPAVPTLSAPANNANITDTTPTFNWSDSKPDLHHYELQIAKNSAFTQGVVKYNNIAVSIFTPTTALTPGTYYWRVRAYNAAGKFSAWSAVWKFTIQ
ncbi:MAG: M4 family metallopeptidase [Chloroflexi bacterium]|nr:M4 family metallopeptidase [Chloroflexota bacterium]